MRAQGLAEIDAAGELRGCAGWTERMVMRLGRLLRAAGLPAVSRRRQQLRVVEQVALGNRRQLFLVACAGERYLVGAGSETVGSIVRVMGRAAQIAEEREEGAFPAERGRGLRPEGRL